MSASKIYQGDAAVVTIKEFYQKNSRALGLQQLVVSSTEGVSLEAPEQFCFLEQVVVPMELEAQVACVVVPPSCVQDYLISVCKSQGVALMVTSLNLDSFFLMLTECLGPPAPHSVARYGTFVQVWDQGVMIRGESGSGKSDLALALVDRNHQLVADDQIEFLVRDQRLHGRCPKGFQGFVEIRGLGD
ncbi:HPr kinase/phosphatase C-terminal domain-containing protein [Pseudomonadota bacterium]